MPAAITGTERLWLGPFPKPRRVQIAFGPPIPVAEIASTPEEAGRLVEQVLWPRVEDQFGRLLARPGLIAAALAAVGVGGGVAFQRGRRPRRRTLDPRRVAGSGAARALAARAPRRRRSSLADRAGRWRPAVRRGRPATELLRRARRR